MRFCGWREGGREGLGGTMLKEVSRSEMRSGGEEGMEGRERKEGLGWEWRRYGRS